MRSKNCMGCNRIVSIRRGTATVAHFSQSRFSGPQRKTRGSALTSQMNMRTGILFAIGLSWCAGPLCSFPQSESAALQMSVEDHGSVPPLNPWFTCIHDLEHRPYDKRKTQHCLDSILSHPEIEKGTFARSKDIVTFSLESPTLVVTDLDLDVPPGELARFHELFSANEAVNGDALHVGEPYTRRRETQVWFGMDLFLRSEGRRAGVSRTLRLDYSKKTAQIDYRVRDAPRHEPEPLGPPFGAPCKVLNANFNGFDSDDLTPVEYIRQHMKTKWLGCFSENDLREDEEVLKKLPFLKESKISVVGSGSSRDFGFHFRSDPIPIAKVTVHGYGLLAGLSEASIPMLAIHVGDTYSTTRFDEQAASLKNAYEKADRQLKLFTDVGITPKGEATLDFSLVAYPDDIVYIGGKAYDVTSKWNGPYVPD